MSLKRLTCPNCTFPILYNTEMTGEKLRCSACKKSFRPRIKSHKLRKPQENPEEEAFSEEPPAETEPEKEEFTLEAAGVNEVADSTPARSKVVKRELDYNLILSSPADSEEEDDPEDAQQEPTSLKSTWLKLRNLQDNGKTILTGFFCLGSGVLLVNFPYVDYMVIPVSLFGALIGYQSYRGAIETANKRWALMLMGLGIVFAVFVLSFPRYFRNLPEGTKSGDLPDGYESTVALGKSVEELPWLDGTTPVIKRGIKIQLKECALKQYKPKNFTGFEKKNEVPLMLHLRISITNENKDPLPYPGVYSKLVKVMDFKGDVLPNWEPKTNAPDNNNPKALLDPGETREFLFYYDPTNLTQNQVKIQIPGILFGFPQPIRFEVKSIPKINI